MTEFFLPAVAGAAIAALVVSLLMRRSSVASTGADPAVAKLQAELAGAQGRIAELDRGRDALQGEITALRAQLEQAVTDRAGLQASLDAERRQSGEKLALLQSARDEMTNQFKVLAADILEEKSTRFVEVNQQAITTLLTPFHGDLVGLREKVNQVHLADATDRAALKEQLRLITEATEHLHDDANNLTKALKGDAKVQGDYGEMLLDRMLDSVGFVEPTNYTRQGSQYDDEGNRLIPDVVVHLPGERHLVVDSKVSLTAYVDLVAADSESARAGALKRHIDSVYAHIKELSAKNYQSLYGLSAIDFVIMFIPNDGAFLAAITGDGEIPAEGWKKNVLVVSPSTLLFTLRTIAHLWRQEAQARNAMEIAKRGGQLYDKFVAFAQDLLEVGAQLDKARGAFDDARKKLSTGHGNLVGQAEKLTKLGIKGQKAMPKELAELAADDEGDEPPALAAGG